jgi:hypothetical protein
MVFGTNNIERMMITADGKVGIGTSAPLAPLHVINHARIAGGSALLEFVSDNDSRSRYYCGSNHFSIGIHTWASFIWNHSATLMHFGTNSIERMRITADGNVGIGTETPRSTLDVRGTMYATTAVFVKLEDATNGYIALKPGYSDTYTGFVEFFSPGGNRMGFIGNGSSSQFQFQIEEERDIQFATSNTGRMWIKSGGRVGIKTSTPEYDLDVYNGSIRCVSLTQTSDKRIKKNIREINGNVALSQIRQIQPTIYNFIDEKIDDSDIYGFIAQDVKKIISNSTNIVPDFVPNLYSPGNICVIDASNLIYEISSENDLIFEKIVDNSGNEITNYKIKLIGDNNSEYICYIVETIVANKRFHVKLETEYKKSNNNELFDTIFIYGQYVNDFHNIKKDAIWTIATAALQEVDRQQQADKARIAELENHVSSLEATVAAQQSLINDILERLKTLEKA